MLPDEDLTRAAVSQKQTPQKLIAPGRQFGSYRVGRLLGRGGMGEVYECEHLDTHRRVALKVLNHSLDTEAGRLRFLREGQLAASINHPNSLYVFGTEEIDGTMAIAMEVASGGTLRDAVNTGGPMPAAAAVDAILQVINGLEAAAAAGVLHRDVKPSNCFVDGHGGVKIGDFGLSIATAGPGETHLTLPGTLLGTPAFAPPEQIRGGPLDVRSDIYSSGATLFYLLTGRAPFAADGVGQLIANVLECDAGSPKQLNAGLPDGLAQIVQRCLAKDPAARPDSYQRLRRELVSFSSEAPRVATPGERVIANILDSVLTSLPISVLFDFIFRSRPDAWGLARVSAELVVSVLYFGVLEGVWRASLGKMAFGLRVIRPGHDRAGIARALVRAAIFSGASGLPLMLLASAGVFARALTGPRLSRELALIVVVQLICWAILFSTARRRNGFAGLHDLASGTRAVRVFDAPVREPLPLPESRVEVGAHARRVGPYAIVGSDTERPTGVLLGYDDVLRRRVWIRSQPVGTPGVPPARRDLARPVRLRWLTGMRTAEECWDAYHAPEGLPFVMLSRDRLAWPSARYWIFDVVRELQAAATEDHRDVTLDLEHIWIATSNRAVLLDFRCPGLPTRGSSSIDGPAHPWTPGGTDAFVRKFVRAALGLENIDSRERSRSSTALAGRFPLHAHAFLKQLDQGQFLGLNAMATALGDSLGKRAVLTRGRRTLHLALSAVVPACFLIAGIVSSGIRGRFSGAAIVAPLTVSFIFLTTFGIWSAALFRGGLVVQALGMALVTDAGHEVSRQRAFVRAVVAWSPWLLFIVAVLMGSAWLGAAALICMIAGSALAALNPAQGVQDRIVRTWLVPR